ncbi:hypothetical protein [uncultured Paraglaciecola sp.]|uniref:hypothetical protein n=1 Tax=uncultured Paraglaciecola sp. TaxID=1765024 RepID=UPI002618F8C4|nr:hypothetical protein [uncultured Paraglaciecola sp.]
MNTSALTAVGIAALGSLGFLGGVGSIDIANKFTKPPTHYHLDLKSLTYENGEFHQLVVPVGRAVIQANWSAKVLRGTHILCDGGNTAPYEGSPVSFTPSDWTGDKCPDLMAGDVAIASWEYKTNEGFTASIVGKVTIK